MKGKFKVVVHTDIPHEDCHQLHDDIYLIKDKHYIYICRHNDRQTEDWPLGFDRLATITPVRMNTMKSFTKDLPGFN